MIGACSWPALALACGLPLGKEGQPLIVSPSQHCKRRHAAGAPLHESLFVQVVLQALRRGLIGACMDYEPRNPVKVRTSALCIFFLYLSYIVKNCKIYLIIYKKIIIYYF